MTMMSAKEQQLLCQGKGQMTRLILGRSPKLQGLPGWIMSMTGAKPKPIWLNISLKRRSFENSIYTLASWWPDISLGRCSFTATSRGIEAGR